MNALLKLLSDKLTAAGIDNTAEESDDFDTDDNINIKTPSAEGFEISIQVANDFSPRGGPDHSVNAWDEKALTMYHVEEEKSKTPDMVVETIQSLISGNLRLSKTQLKKPALAGFSHSYRTPLGNTRRGFHQQVIHLIK